MLLLQKQLTAILQRDGGLTAAIVGGAAALGATGGQMYANAKMNKRAVNYNREAYARQRADALADWAMQNEYNSPKAQMQRFKEAGLNPNLIYGQMNEGAAVRSSDMGSVDWSKDNIMPAGEAVSNSFSNYQSWRANEQALKNAEEQNKVLKSQVAETAANTANILQQTMGHEFDLGQKKRLADTAFATANEALNNARLSGQNMQLTGQNIVAGTENLVALNDKIRTETGIAIKDYQLREALNKSTIAQAGAAIMKSAAETRNINLTSRQIDAAIENMKKDGKLKDYEIELNRKGLQKNDSLLMRMIGDLFSEASKGAYQGTPPPNSSFREERMQKFKNR